MLVSDRRWIIDAIDGTHSFVEGKVHWGTLIGLEIAGKIEHVCVPGVPMQDYLRACRHRGVSLLHGMGFQMISKDFPAPHELLCATRTIDAPFARESKLSIFDPQAVECRSRMRSRHGSRKRPRGNPWRLRRRRASSSPRPAPSRGAVRAASASPAVA